RHQLLSLHRAAFAHDLVGRGAGQQPGIPTGWRRRSDPADPRLHGLGLLGVPRQGRYVRGLSLMAGDIEPRLSMRLLWFAGLWLPRVGRPGALPVLLSAPVLG